ncbi:MAG: 4Fe-4S dicluster domain-containing protein [Oligoflexia bacterium]|nr:4Fe-4S dicluster domain-containing protein [Oligoflexia bacterium]
MDVNATREIMWSIPAPFKTIMYVLFVVSTLAMIKGLYDKLQFAVKGEGVEGLKKLLPEKLNWSNFLKTSFLTGKVPRFQNVATLHGLIFYGFVILWIATDLVAIHYDTPFKVFHGTTYIVISFLADMAGLMILVGLCMAYYRRYVLKPDYLSATKPSQEKMMYAMLFALVIIGYFIEGLRILGTGMPIGEKSWSPVGWMLASIFQNFNFSDAALANTYRGLWFFHMVNTMAFIISIGYTKFSHIVFLPFASLVTPPRRGAVLEPMNFEDENAETFGLGKLSELTHKNTLDLLTCVECGRCTQVCPANLAGKPLDPKKIITKTRDLAYETKAKGETDAELWGESPIFMNHEIDACTTCGACMEECPANIEHVDIIMEAKRYKTLTLGEIQPAAGDAANKIRVNGNPWGITQDDRFKWADGLDVPVITPEKKVDYLYYVGCAGSYDASNQKVVQDTVMLLKKAGVDFAVMGKTEKCNGDPIRRFGDEYTFYEVAIENIANMNQYKFDKVVTHCPHCLHTIGKEYAKFEDGAFETVHHTELLGDLVRTGKLKPTKPVNQELTYHDPCYLGRHHGEYDAPREILKAIPGITLTEMDKNRDKALCCGMGGGNMWYELPEGEHIAVNRLKEIGDSKAPKLATSCSYCLINFHSSKGQVDSTENLEIDDIASILAESVD